MKTDAQIQKDVMDQLKWNPFLNASEIGVSVKNGVVTLSGQVDSFSKKMAAERSTKAVMGVKGIAENIQINVSPAFHKTDAEIADVALQSLKWHSAVPNDRIQVKVENGHVTLEGEVDWDFQRTSARKAVENISGVRNVRNNITLKPKITSDDIKNRISAAFHRAASLDANRISVEIVGSKAILRGKVRSYVEKEEANVAAFMAPGITQVEDYLEIIYEETDILAF